MTAHVEALPAGAQKAAALLASFPWLSDFYLAGGTALALQYGHRISVDLDFFSPTNELTGLNRQRITVDLAAHKVKIEEEKDGTLHLRLLGTHVSFFVYRYPLLRRTHKWNGIALADPVDIGLMKIGAVMGRGSKKDFFDLHQIFLKEIDLRSLLRLSKKKFKLSLDFPLQACQALVYFDQADQEPTPRLLTKSSWPEVRAFFQREVKRTARILI